MSDLNGKKVAMLATDYFEESELFGPKEALEQAGATVEVIAPHDGEIKGLRHVEPGKSAKVDKTLDQATPEDYDALVLPGGAVNADHLRVEQKAQAFATKMLNELERPVAVICHGPWLLVSARLVRGKRLTSYHTIRDDLMNAGAEWVDEEVVVDGNLISSRKPSDLPAFNEVLLAALKD
jgi:protease I